ncbi:hypothetical protein QA596_10815 [Balneolales bacterium ANBcel1]|nr:hypothetical protein [Balneolales bacterium ANBcel1]
MKGLKKVLSMGPKTDVSQLILMWTESLLMPSVWNENRQIGWSANGKAGRVQMVLPVRESREKASIRFDARTGLASEFSALRPGLDGPRLPWVVTVRRWSKRNGQMLPDLDISWGNTGETWLTCSVNDLSLNVASGKMKKVAVENA